jgi:hypothetical protein
MNSRQGLLSLVAVMLLTSSGFAQKNMLERDGLSGPVRSVETTFVQGDKDIRDTMPLSLEIYDRDGFLIERYRFNESGGVILHTTFTRNRWKVMKEVNDTAKPEEGGSVAIHEDKQDSAKSPEADDSNRRPVNKLESPPIGSSANQIPGSGSARESETIREASQSEPHTHLTPSTVMCNGEATSLSAAQWSPAGAVYSVPLPDGSCIQTTVNGDGYVTRLHDYNAPMKIDSLTLNDSKGRTLERTQSSLDAYSKSVFTRESDGSEATETMLDRDGKATVKFRYEYQKDAYGNWIEQRRFTWHYGDKLPHWVEDTTTRRVIAYY